MYSNKVTSILGDLFIIEGCLIFWGNKVTDLQKTLLFLIILQI